MSRIHLTIKKSTTVFYVQVVDPSVSMEGRSWYNFNLYGIVIHLSLYFNATHRRLSNVHHVWRISEFYSWIDEQLRLSRCATVLIEYPQLERELR